MYLFSSTEILNEEEINYKYPYYCTVHICDICCDNVWFRLVEANSICDVFILLYIYIFIVVTNQSIKRCPPGTPVFSTNKTDCHDIAEILLKVASMKI